MPPQTHPQTVAVAGNSIQFIDNQTTPTNAHQLDATTTMSTMPVSQHDIQQPDIQQQQHQRQQTLESNPDSNQSMPFVFYDTPYTRRQLAKYILNEFHEIDLNSVLDNSPSVIESSRKDVFGPVISEALVEGGATSTNYHGPPPIHGGHLPGYHKPYFGEVFDRFSMIYMNVHPWVSLVICTLGILANLINVIVLTRPNMISAVNTILCAIACSDLIVNLSSIPYLMHELSGAERDSNYYSRTWAYYTLTHAHVTVTSHTISIWLTCALATWRYCVIRSQSSSKRNWSVSLAIRVIIGVVVLVPVFCIPNYLSFAILKDENNVHKVGFSGLARSSQFIKTFHFWMFSCLTKLLPCLMLTYFTTVLINARERRLRLTNNLSRNSSGAALPEPKGHMANGNKSLDRRKISHDEDGHGARLRASGSGGDLEDRPGVCDKVAANGFKLKSGLLTKTSLGKYRRAKDKIIRTQPDVGITSMNRDNVQCDSGAGGDVNNLQLLAKGMMMQARNALQIEEESAKFQKKRKKKKGISNDNEEEGFAHEGRPTKIQQDGATHTISTRTICDPGSSLEPQGVQLNGRRNHNQHLLFSSMGSRDNVNTAGTKNGLVNNFGEDNNGSNNNLACQMAPNSGSSCATDAECVAVSVSASSDASSSNTIDHTAQQQQGTLQQHHPQQLLVETNPTSMQAVSTTTRALMLTSNDQANLIGNDEEQLDKYQTSARSASTGGVLELYAINNNGGAQSRLTMANVAHRSPKDGMGDFYADAPTMAASNRKNNMTANRSGSANLERNSSLDVNGGSHGSLVVTGLKGSPNISPNQMRPRSIGSASFAPLQVVRFQATHRQLSQNETTTRLLIAVIIVFLICEFPAGILAALCAILGEEFFENVYQPMGTLTDLLALINSSVNFILYCFMSTQFRITFYRVVLRCPAPRDINSHK